MKKSRIILCTIFTTCLFLFLIGIILYSFGLLKIIPHHSTDSSSASSAVAFTSTTEPVFPAKHLKTPIIVLDPGHGKSSAQMTSEERKAAGWLYSPPKKGWGEWRHWKSHTIWQDCEGHDCIQRVPTGGSCWYKIEDGDRDTEPQINLRHALIAKDALEEMGYTVRMTRTNNDENPSMTKRLTYCYPEQDTTKPPDAALFICLHANAGGGQGSYYIQLSGQYDQAGIPPDYIQKGNQLGQIINQQIVDDTSLLANLDGVYTGYPELILFCKSPIPIAYLEIGFFDHPDDCKILQSESTEIGNAIAKGIDKYCKNYLSTGLSDE